MSMPPGCQRSCYTGPRDRNKSAPNVRNFAVERESGRPCARPATSLGSVDEEPPRHRHWLLPLRMLLAGLFISVLTGGAVATAGLLQLNDIAGAFDDSPNVSFDDDTIAKPPPG